MKTFQSTDRLNPVKRYCVAYFPPYRGAPAVKCEKTETHDKNLAERTAAQLNQGMKPATCITRLNGRYRVIADD